MWSPQSFQCVAALASSWHCMKVSIIGWQCRGLYLNARTLGPMYRIVIRDRNEDGPILAVSFGFTVPAMGLMHCDSLQIFTRGWAPCSERNPWRKTSDCWGIWRVNSAVLQIAHLSAAQRQIQKVTTCPLIFQCWEQSARD